MKIVVENLFISDGHNYYGRHGKKSEDYAIVSVSKVEVLAGRGIVGDRFLDYKEDYKGQITFFDVEAWRFMEEKMGQAIEPMRFRRNVLLSGIDLNDLIGKTFEIDGVRYSGSEEARPCYWMDEACGEGAEELLKGRGGLRARILDDGELVVGEAELRVLA